MKPISLKSDLLEDFKSFMLMHRKGMKDSEIMDSLMIKVTPDIYFQPLFKKYTKLMDYMDSNSFYEFIYHLENTSTSLITNLLSTLAYPIVLYIATILSAFFFDKSIIPLLNDSILLFSDSNESLLLYQIVLKFFWILSLIFLGIFLITILRLQNNTNLIKFYEKIYHLNGNNVLINYFSSEFAKYYLSLLQNGLSTNIIINSLVAQNASCLANYLALDIRTALNNGKKLTNIIENIHFDVKLKQVFKIGEKTGELKEMLSDYLEINEILIKRKINKISKVITYSIYLLVSLFIAIFYRLLMSPLAVIKSL